MFTARLLRDLPDARAGLRDHAAAGPAIPRTRRRHNLLRHPRGDAGHGNGGPDEAWSGEREHSRSMMNGRKRVSSWTKQGPHFPSPLVEPGPALEEVISTTSEEATRHLDYVFKAITLTRHRLEGKVPLLGFTGAPVIRVVTLSVPSSSPRYCMFCRIWMRRQ